MRSGRRCMTIGMTAAMLISIAIGAAAAASELLKGNPLDGLYIQREGRAMRVSSSDPAWAINDMA